MEKKIGKNNNVMVNYLINCIPNLLDGPKLILTQKIIIIFFWEFSSACGF
jgi:hypothetical protein